MSTVFPLPKVIYTKLADVEESRDVALIYSQLAWDAVSDALRLKVTSQGEVREATQEHFDALAADARGEVIYAVGGGLAADAAKYVSVKTGLPFVCVPTAMTVDAFFTWASGVRGDGCVKYLVTKPPDEVIADLEVLAAAPDHLRAAGICDVLSIATGCADWEYAHAKGLNPPAAPYDAPVAAIARGILGAALEAAEAAGRGDHQGLQRLIDCLMLEVQLCNQIGHSRPEEGSEHYFAYAVENVMGKGLPHGDLVGPGIVIAARLQGIDAVALESALRKCLVPLDKISEQVSRDTLRILPDYCRKHALAHGIAHDLTEPQIDAVSVVV